MARGRKKTPNRSKIIAGKIPGSVRGGVPARLRVPDWLDETAKAKWRALVPELRRLGLLATTDSDCLAAYCQAWAEFRLSTQTLQKEGRVATRGNGGICRHPAAEIQRVALCNLRNYAALLGLSPADRSRLRVQPVNTERDELEEFMADHG